MVVKIKSLLVIATVNGLFNHCSKGEYIMVRQRQRQSQIDVDIQKRFDAEKKYVLDPVDEKEGNNFFTVMTSIVMISLVLISLLYTLLSMLK